MQRSQIEDLIQSMARSRDENVLADVEAAIRVAQQQSAITAAPTVDHHAQADRRTPGALQPAALERVRRAVAQDLERARAPGHRRALLTLRLDEVIRLVDELPLLSAVDRKPAADRPGGTAGIGGLGVAGWTQGWGALQGMLDQIWDEARSLVRVTRIDMPEAMLVAPEQAFFLRENLKLRLLNARWRC